MIQEEFKMLFSYHFSSSINGGKNEQETSKLSDFFSMQLSYHILYVNSAIYHTVLLQKRLQYCLVRQQISLWLTPYLSYCLPLIWFFTFCSSLELWWSSVCLCKNQEKLYFVWVWIWIYQDEWRTQGLLSIEEFSFYISLTFLKFTTIENDIIHIYHWG